MEGKESLPRKISNFTKLNIERVRKLFNRLPDMSTPGEGELRNRAMPMEDFIKRHGKAPDYPPDDLTKDQ